MQFTTRPELAGTFGMATSTHWLASACGMRLLEKGGTAFDAAAGMSFVLNVVEPHLCGPLGEVPAIFQPADHDQPIVLCGQGVAPAGATIDHYRREGLDVIPGSGLLATVNPGAFDAWMMLLHDYGRLTLREVMEPAIYYARHGHPMLQLAANKIASMADFFQAEWPSSAAVWLPGGQAPKAGDLFCNTELADFWDRLLTEAESVSSREAQLSRARQVFSQGFVAEAIDQFLDSACVTDATGQKRKGVLNGQDMADWTAQYETPLSVTHNGWTAFKCGPWTQGPAFLQALRMLEDDDLSAIDPNGAEFVHRVTEAIKLSFADRDAYFGDPNFTNVPLDVLLDKDYAKARRALIGASASHAHNPGFVDGHEDARQAYLQAVDNSADAGAGAGAGEPTMAHLTEKRGDTVHLDVVDRWGNMISATASGGWLQSNPVVPGLGVPLNSRAQMFWLDPNSNSALQPGKRPRTTLTPGFAHGPDGTRLAFGTPGGDQQDQWQLAFFLRHAHHGMNLQQAIDAPLFMTLHPQSSFYPRISLPGHLMVEPALGTDAIEELRAKGHDLHVAPEWTIGRLTAASRNRAGILKAAATPRLMQAYAAGR